MSEIIDQSADKIDTSIDRTKSKFKEDPIMETNKSSSVNEPTDPGCQQQNNEKLQGSADEQNNSTSNNINEDSESVTPENQTAVSENTGEDIIDSNGVVPDKSAVGAVTSSEDTQVNGHTQNNTEQSDATKRGKQRISCYNFI